MCECAGHPEEDVVGGVEACSKDAYRIRWVSLADYAAGKAGDGALNQGTLLVHGGCVGHHKIDGILSRTANLQGNRQGELDEEASRPIRECRHFILFV